MSATEQSRYAGVDPSDKDAFAIRHATLPDGGELAYVREGIGGVPLLMLHGYPGTKRIFYRNIGPLADAGFEVIVPDARGWGDSPLPERYSDPISSARDFKALMEQLGHPRWVQAAFDFGSMTAIHMSNRFGENVVRQVLWNALVPLLSEEYKRAGVDGNMIAENAEVSSHIADHGTDSDAFAAKFASDEERRRYIMGFYQGRVWKAGEPPRNLAGPGNFDDQAAAFHADPFADAARFRAALNYYAFSMGASGAVERSSGEPADVPMLDRQVQTETMFMFGEEDEILALTTATRDRMLRRAEIGFANLCGPFVVQGGGHFLSWERPEIVNNAIRCFCRDLLEAR